MEEWEALVRGGALLPDYWNYPQLPGFPRWIWHCAYWDGPLSGPALYQNEVVWLECAAEGNHRRRRFLVIRFAPREWEAEQTRQQLFEDCVGHHNTYDPSGRVRRGHVHPQSRWTQYYEQYPPEWAKQRVAASGPVWGWVEEGADDDENEKEDTCLAE